jgi:hypothetical protein
MISLPIENNNNQIPFCAKRRMRDAPEEKGFEMPAEKRIRQEVKSLSELSDLYYGSHLEVVARGLLHDFAGTFKEIPKFHYSLVSCVEAARFLMNVGHEVKQNETSPKLRKLARSLLARDILPSVTIKIDLDSETHIFTDYFSAPDINCARLKPLISFFSLKSHCDMSGRDSQNVFNFVKALALHTDSLIKNSIQLEDLTKLIITTKSWNAMPLAGVPALYNYLRQQLLRKGAASSINKPPKDPGKLEWPLWEKFTWRGISCGICDRCQTIFSGLNPEKQARLFEKDLKKIALLLLQVLTRNHTSFICRVPAEKLMGLMQEVTKCKLTWRPSEK